MNLTIDFSPDFLEGAAVEVWESFGAEESEFAFGALLQPATTVISIVANTAVNPFFNLDI
jgi:hypothetical protein